jgi:3-methyladenine DNA glycosylase AlkD
MKLDDIMRELERMGTAQNVKIYKRHGAKHELFGVSFANLSKLKKQIKTDSELGKKLLATNNADAQTLGTMIIDPNDVTEDELNTWVKRMDYYPVVDSFVKNLVSKTEYSKKMIDKWTKSKDEWVGRAGWQLLAIYIMNDKNLPDQYYEKYLEKIEKNIHNSKNRTRESMNNALISIGIRNKNLMNRALHSAKTIGVVEVDHGETGCVTPDAAEYINKTWVRKEKKNNRKIK